MSNEEIDESEVFRPIPGYEGLYEINLLGQVWSCKRNKFRKIGLIGERPMVSLCKDGKPKWRDLTYLMVKAFYPHSSNFDTVDGNPFNLHWDNLMAAHE